MDPVIVVLSFLFLGMGSVGIVGLGILAYRSRLPLLLRFFWLDLVLGGGLMFYLGWAYLQTVISLSGLGGGPVESILQAFSATGMLALYGLFVWLLQGWPPGNRGVTLFRRFTQGIWLFIVVLVCGSLLAQGIPGFSHYLPSVPPVTGFVLITAAVFFTGLVLWMTPQPPGPPVAPERFLTRWWGAAMLAFLPLSGLEAWLQVGPLRNLHALQVEYLLFFFCNVGVVVTLILWLRNPPAGAPFSVTNGVEPWGLTTREREIIPLIAQGMANKQIAAELGISPATVRTHVYNLFQKVGVQSRIELLNKVNALRGPDEIRP